MEILILNVLKTLITVGETPQYKLLFCEIIEYLGQLNQELFIPLSVIINLLVVISDLEAEIGDILTRKVHQLDLFDSILHMFHLIKGHRGNDFKHKSQDICTIRCGKDYLKSNPKKSDMQVFMNVQTTPFQVLNMMLIPSFPQLFHI